MATIVFVFGALTQLLMGRLVDRFALPAIFAALALLQPAGLGLGLGLAPATTGVPLLVGPVLGMASIYGQVVMNDAMVARYVPPGCAPRRSACATFLGFTTSGLAVPLIALLHGWSGFQTVLGFTAMLRWLNRGAVIA